MSNAWNWKSATGKAIATTFGAAMASVYSVPDLNADIVNLSFSPPSVAFRTNTATSQVALLTTNGQIGSFGQWNDVVGKTLNFLVGTGSNGLQSWDLVVANQSIGPGSFVGLQGLFGSFAPSAAGVAYVGFRTNAGNVGWFSVDFGGTGGAVVYLRGQYGNGGETLRVGRMIPEPSSVGLAGLAFGAMGLQRRRRQQQSQRQAA